MTLDPKLIASRFGKALDTYDQAATVQQEIADQLVHLLAKSLATPPNKVLEIGCGTGLLTQQLYQHYPHAHYTLNDLVPKSEAVVHEKLPQLQYRFLSGDAEQIDWGHGYHLIASSSAIQWWQQPTHFFTKAYQSLTAGGWLACSTFLPNNMSELTPILPHTLAYPTAQECHEALAPFALAESHKYTATLHFPNLLALLQHLKATGTNALPTHQKGLWTHHHLRTMESTLRQHLDLKQEDPLPLTYKTILILAKK